MVKKSRKIEIEVESFLGTESAYWHGNSLRIALPNEVKDKMAIRRLKGFSENDVKEKKTKFAFYNTDKGLLVCKLDDNMNEKFKDALSFSGKMSNEDLEFMFERGIFP